VLGAVAASLARLLADVPGSVSLAVGAWGIAAFVAGSLALAVKTPNRADALLPLIALIVLPIMLPVAAMTVVAQGLLWFPDALDTRDRTPSLPGPDGLRRKPLDDLARYGN
jgi:ABC-type transport system involved in cytochrome c biogenesis permease component